MLKSLATKGTRAKGEKPLACVITLNGSNCDAEAVEALATSGFQVILTEGTSHLPQGIELCVIPGGFTYGDTLRPGAIAASLPIIQEVRNFAKTGGLILGICNGFQILTECKLLPGALLQNASGSFVCKRARLKCANTSSAFTKLFKEDTPIVMQLAHRVGRYYIPPDAQQPTIAMQYCNNVNGSWQNTAAILGGESSNIMGIMPHPERSLAAYDGIKIFQSLKQHLTF